MRFTGLTHAHSFSFPDSRPKISVDQICTEGVDALMPVSVNVHHGLADDYHVWQFLAAFLGLLG